MTEKDVQSSHMTPRTGRPAFELDEICSGSGLTELLHRLCHEVDNPLTAIISMATVIERIGPDDSSDEFRKEKLPRYGRAIASEAWRASRLLEKLIFIASNRPPVESSADLGTEIRAALADIQDIETYESVPIGLSIDQNLLAVSAEPHQLKLLLSELLDNAHFSCARSERKEPVNISAYEQEGFALVEISSWSAQSCPFELSKVFEPFVSDRQSHKKLGLGLTLSYAIVRRFGGELSLSEHPEDGGYRFNAQVKLPLRSSDKVETPIAHVGAKPRPKQTSESSPDISVLVIEDEQTVASAIRKILELGVSGAGSVNCVCTDGSSYSKIVESGVEFDAVLCDLNLKDCSGRTIFKILSEEYPQLADRFAFLTGDGHRAETISFFKSTARPYLLKPFEPADLVALVQELAGI